MEMTAKTRATKLLSDIEVIAIDVGVDLILAYANEIRQDQQHKIDFMLSRIHEACDKLMHADECEPDWSIVRDVIMLIKLNDADAKRIMA